MIKEPQSKLKDTEQELSKKLEETQAELDNKKKELEEAWNENKEKSALIEELKKEIDNLQKNADNYKKQIDSINAELATLRTNFDNNKQSTEQQTTTEQQITTEQQTTTEQTNNQPDIQSDTQDDIKLDSYEWYIKALSQLIFEIDWCTATAKYKRWLNKSWKETLKTAKAKLNQYKDTISGKKSMLEHEFKQKNKLNSKNPDKAPLTLSITEAEINELKNRRFEWRKQIEIDIKEWQNWKSSNIAPRPNQSLEQVKKWNNVDAHHNEYDSRLNDALKDAALLRIIDNNQDKAREFLQAIANNSLSDQQITFCQTHMIQLSPYFEQYGLTNQVHKCIQTRGWRCAKSVINYWNMDWETAYKTWWVVGWLNNTLIKAFPNAKPEQVSSFTNIAVAAGWIYAIYRIWKWFFGKNKDWERNLWLKIAWLAWIYFAPQLLLGKDWYSLLWEILSWKADFSELSYRASNCLWFMNNNNPEVYNQMAPGLLWMHIFPQTYTVADVKALQQTFSDQTSRKQWYTTTYNRLNKNNSALANEFKNTFNENQYDESEWKAFLAKLGITDKTREDAIVFNEAAKITDKKTSFELWMKSQWKEINPAFEKEVDGYLKENWEFDPNFFNKEEHKNWLRDNNEAKYTIREEDINRKRQIWNQIDELSLSDQDKNKLKEALELFYDERSIESKPNPNDFNLEMDNDFLILTSHSWYKAKIDINKNEIIWFWNGIKFTKLSDLLNTADLANKILEIQKWKSPKDMPPFEYKIGKKWRWIYFNDADFSLSSFLSFDTRVLSGGRWWKIGEIDTLSNHPEDYADYLSKRRIEENKINVDSTLYPTVKALSDTWIDFFNEQEVKDLEAWLKSIKEWQKFSVWTTNWEPYKISRRFTSLSDKLVFTAVNWDDTVFKEDLSSKFPTIMQKDNQSKFENFMNNKKNGMRWYAIK